MASENWNCLEDKAYGFITIPPRTAKPRERGLTVVSDKRVGMRAMADMFDLVGDFVDWMKYGFSAVRIVTPELMQKKIEFGHANNVKAFIAGDVTEMGLMQGRFDAHVKQVIDLGADGMEIATAQVSMDLSEKCLLVEKAARAGLKLFAEVGKKGFASLSVSPSLISKEIQALKDAGAYKLIIQGEGVLEDVEVINDKLLFEIAARHDINDIIFQGKDNRAHTWLIQNFGPEVNMDVESEQVVVVELCRRGIRKRGLFGLIAGAKQ